MSRAGIVLPRLRDVCAAALTSLSPPVEVFLGPIVSGDPDDAFFVGYDGDPFGEMEAVVHTQNWGALGNRSRDEEFDVRCCILNRSGQDDADGIAAAITRMYAMFDAIATAIHSNPSIGLGPPTTAVMLCSIRGLASFMTLTPNGVEPRVSFNVHVQTRV